MSIYSTMHVTTTTGAAAMESSSHLKLIILISRLEVSHIECDLPFLEQLNRNT